MSAFAQLVPGSIFAQDFRVVGPLSEGGMGAVYVVEQISTGNQRALKLMHPQLVTNANLRQRFVQEAKIGSLIKSDHVVQVVGAGIDAPSGMPWLAMELLDGQDLAHVVAGRGPLPRDMVREVFVQLCHALGAAHAANIVHRDLKPENVFLANSRRAGVPFTVKVLDFGIAKLVADVQTHHTSAMGTPLWMAPEQTEAGGNICPATDVWALGLIAFHVLTGRYYWRVANTGEGSAMALMREVVFEPIAPASARANELGAQQLPPGFDAWFARCVAREIGARFADAAAAGQAFEALLTTSIAAAPTVVPAVAPIGTGTVVMPPGAPAVAPSPAPVAAAQPTVEWQPRVAAAPSTTAPIAANPQPIAPAQSLVGMDDAFDAPRRRSAPWIVGGVVGAAVLGVAIFALSRPSSDTKPGQSSPPSAESTKSGATPEKSAAMAAPSVGASTTESAASGDATKPSKAKLVETGTDIQGRLAPEALRKVIHDNFGRIQSCYEQGLAKNPGLKGTVSVAFVINESGKVESATSNGGSLTDPTVTACIVGVYRTLTFPKPDGGKVKVVYPIDFQPGG